MFGGRGEQHAVVHLQPVHVASALCGHHIGFAVYNQTTAIVPRQVLAWNEHMQTIFVATWALCLDESMSIWNNQWTCPGWVFCPRKPWPFGNEYHTACCGLSGIMFVMEMVEGKDHPPQVVPRYSELGKATRLLMRILQSYFSTGRYVVLDSGFCVS